MGVLRAVAANSLGRTLGGGGADLLSVQIKVALVTSAFKTDVEWPARVNSTAYVVDDIVRPATASGHAYVCTVAGTSHTSPPTYPESGGGGGTVTDGGVTWMDLGLMPPLREYTNRGFITSAVAWTSATAKVIGDFVWDPGGNGHVYEAMTNGTTSGGSPFPGSPDPARIIINDNGIDWQDLGMNPAGAQAVGVNYTAGGAIAGNADWNLSRNMANTLNLDDVVFVNATVTARYAVAYINGTIGTHVNPFVGFALLNDDPADVGSIEADFAVRWSPAGALRIRAPRPA